MDKKEKEHYLKIMNEIDEDLDNLILKYKELSSPCCVIYRLISKGCTIALCTAKDELAGVKTIMSCIEHAISEYEDNYS